MIRLRIDGVECDLPAQESLPHFGKMYDLAALADPSAGRTGRAMSFRLPSSPCNDAVMGRAADIFGGSFNDRRHEAEVEVDGTVLLAGSAVLEAVEAAALPDTDGPLDAEEGAVCDGAGRVTYVVRVAGDAASWAETAARTDFDAIALDYDAVLDGDTVIASWDDSSPVKFLPVHRDSYDASYSSTSIYSPQRIGSVGDYHPFLSVGALMRALFAAGGYEAAGSFMEGPLLQRLYMSGRYASDSTERAASSMGFCAGRTSEASAEADGMGRVYLSPLVLANSLGNFVQTADPAAAPDLYANGRALTIDGEGVRFTPTSEVTAGFELVMDYTTDYRILTRERLAGFDALYVDSGCDISYRLANPFIDRRESLTAGTTYRCVVFGHAAGATYRVVCRYGTQTTALAIFSARTAEVSIPAGASGARCELQVAAADGSYDPYTGDWALYDGHVGETGTTRVEMTLRTAPERLSAGAAKSFVRMYLHGAEPGQRVTLGTGCRLRPVFSAAPAAGSHILFADMAHYAVHVPYEEDKRFTASYRGSYDAQLGATLNENEVRYEENGCDNCDYAIVAFGSAARISQKAVDTARKKGYKIGIFRPITLWPFPEKEIARLSEHVKGILVVEINAGQMVFDVRAAVNGRIPVEHFGRLGGIVPDPDEIVQALEKRFIHRK